MVINWARLLPVIVSIAIIITVAIVREYSKTFAAIAAVMPINIPLGMWIVTSGEENSQEVLQQFSGALIINIIPTIVFMLMAWQLARSGTSLGLTIVGGYIAWAIALGFVFLLRHLLGG